MAQVANQTDLASTELGRGMAGAGLAARACQYSGVH